MIYILVEKNPIRPIGIFESEAVARNNAIDGEYLIIPVQINRLYGGGIVSEAMAGAITIKAKQTDLSEAINQVLSRLDTIETQISNAAIRLNDFEARITALEGG